MPTVPGSPSNNSLYWSRKVRRDAIFIATISARCCCCWLTSWCRCKSATAAIALRKSTMTPFANATTPSRAALGTALALGACALFLLVASNVLLLGLRMHDGGLHWSEIATGWPRYGADPRFDRWLTLATLAGVVVVFGMLGAVLRLRPLPLHGSARFASEREIKAAGLRSAEGILLGRKDGSLLCFGGSEHVLVYAPTRAGKGVGYADRVREDPVDPRKQKSEIYLASEEE